LKKINPLPDGLVWIRGVDFEPILTDLETIQGSVKDFEKRYQDFDNTKDE